jgi:uncharacterized protein YceH (UPF0502 family)
MDGEDLHDLARDWITLWQSELAALAADREAQETWRVLLSMWAGAAGALLRAMPREGANDGAGGSARPAAAPRPAAPAAAPDARDAEVERLRQRIADLERRLDGLERGRG